METTPTSSEHLQALDNKAKDEMAKKALQEIKEVLDELRKTFGEDQSVKRINVLIDFALRDNKGLLVHSKLYENSRDCRDRLEELGVSFDSEFISLTPVENMRKFLIEIVKTSDEVNKALKEWGIAKI